MGRRRKEREEEGEGKIVGRRRKDRRGGGEGKERLWEGEERIERRERRRKIGR